MSRERLMARAIARESAQRDPTDLPLPGLANAESSLAVPLLRGEQKAQDAQTIGREFHLFGPHI